MIRFWATIKGLCYREINLFCEEKMLKKKSQRWFFRETYGLGGLGGAFKYL